MGTSAKLFEPNENPAILMIVNSYSRFPQYPGCHVNGITFQLNRYLHRAKCVHVCVRMRLCVCVCTGLHFSGARIFA